jgi:hypothetical protein
MFILSSYSIVKRELVTRQSKGNEIARSIYTQGAFYINSVVKPKLVNCDLNPGDFNYMHVVVMIKYM